MTIESTVHSDCTASGFGAGLIDLLTQQRDVYVQLKGLSDQQAPLIAGGAGEQLLAVLSQRQRLVDALGCLNEELTGCGQRLGELIATLPEAQRDRLRSLMEQVDSLLKAINEQDDRDHHELQAFQQKIASEMNQVSRVGAALNAYRTAPPPAPARFTDRQG